jgi:uncharacterized cupredoxin-like copper-binding protein
MQTHFACAAMVAVWLVTPSAASAHGTTTDNKAKSPISTEEHPFGVEGDPGKVRRTIRLSMDDTMHYSQSQIRVAQGETITFVVTNKGKLLHELVLGTGDELKQHAELMRKNPGMEHDEPYMAHVKPGGTERITWKFTKPGTFYYGCLVAGHFEAGMKGTVVVVANK